MAEMFVTSLNSDGVTTENIDNISADVMQDIWSALKRGDVTLIAWGE